LHFPDSTFVERLDEIIGLLRTRHPELVVLHCMESIRRGPRCARRLRDALERLPSATAPVDASAVRVLRGGADRWLRRHWRGPLVEGWDNAFWGWADADDTCTRGDAPVVQAPGSPSNAMLSSHRLYVRPAGQQVDSGGAR
jgi:hypothetical protein